MANENDRLVIAYFPNKGAAEATAEDLKDWDDANDEIKLGAIAVLTLNPDNGQIEADEIGERSTKSGALWGTVLGGVVGLLTGGIGLIPALLVGAGGGALLGSLNHKSVGISDEERNDIANHLRDGAVALAVMADEFEVDATLKKMDELGGRADYYEIPSVTTAALAAAAEAQSTAVTAVDEAVAAAAGATRAVAADVAALPVAAAAAVAGLVAGVDISDADAVKLHEAGVAKASQLYKLAATPKGRADLAAKSGLSEDAVLVVAKKMDLMRVKGVGPKYATLLVATGVDSVSELAGRNPANLQSAMSKMNETAQIVTSVPAESELANWIAQAKTLPKMLVL